jgi:phosphoribosyl-dephospho-CoA transferase
VIRDLRRHDRVWLDATRWFAALTTPLADEGRAALEEWLAHGRACVARRRDADARPDVACLALALPLAQDRRRIAFAVERSAVTRVDAPLSIDEVVASAPAHRRPALTALSDEARALATPLFAYGSFAWQSISGEACVKETSDLDVLWDARAADQVALMIAAIERCEASHGLRIDGEVRFPDGAAVAWRELSATTARVLVKRDGGVALERSPLAGLPAR